MLNVQAIHDDMGIPQPAVQPKRNHKSTGVKKESRRVAEPEAPLRRSTRHRGPDPNETPERKRKREVRARSAFGFVWLANVLYRDRVEGGGSGRSRRWSALRQC